MNEFEKQLLASFMLIDSDHTKSVLTVTQAATVKTVKEIGEAETLEDLQKLVEVSCNMNDLAISKTLETKKKFLNEISGIIQPINDSEIS